MKRPLQLLALGSALLFSSASQAQEPQLSYGIMGDPYFGLEQRTTLEIDDEHFLSSALIQRPVHDDFLLDLRVAKSFDDFSLYLGSLSRITLGNNSHRASYCTGGISLEEDISESIDFKASVELDIGSTTYLHPQVSFSWRF